MKHRGLLKVFVLDLITFGLYMIYWLVVTRRDMLRLGARDIPSVWVLFLPLIGLVALIPLYAVLRSLADSGGGPALAAVNILLFLGGAALVLAMIIVPFWWMWRYSKGVEHVTKGQTDSEYSFWLWVLTWFFAVTIIWQLIIQYAFNKLPADGDGGPDSGHDGASAAPREPQAPHPAAPYKPQR